MALSAYDLDTLVTYSLPQELKTDLVLNLTASLNNPQGATFQVTQSGGIVITISSVLVGSGYPDGTYQLSFSGGTTAGTVTASASVVASGGKITSINIQNGGSGYSSAPAANLFTPDKSLLLITPTNQISPSVNNTSLFSWYAPSSVTLGMCPRLQPFQ